MAGGDISEFQFGAARPTRRFLRYSIDLYRRMLASPQIIIAAVNGLALGGGAELALYSDLVVASRAATFGFPEARLGVVPGLAIGRLASVVGPHRAKQLMLVDDPISADAAQALGLVNWVVDPGEEVPAAIRMARVVLERGPVACEVIKAVIEREAGGEDFRAMHGALVEVFATDEAIEGAQVFMKKGRIDYGASNRAGTAD